MGRPSATAFLFVTVFVDMLGYGLVVPLLPFYASGLAFVGACAVVTQGLLTGRAQRRFGETGMAFSGLAATAACLVLVGLSPSGGLLYPLVGTLAVGAGLAIPTLTALVCGPLVAGAAFDEIGTPAPYFIGGVLGALALPAVALSCAKGTAFSRQNADVGEALE